MSDEDLFLSLVIFKIQSINVAITNSVLLPSVKLNWLCTRNDYYLLSAIVEE